MFSRLENWLFLKPFVFSFTTAKITPKFLFMFKHSINPLYLTFNVYFVLWFSIR